MNGGEKAKGARAVAAYSHWTMPSLSSESSQCLCSKYENGGLGVPSKQENRIKPKPGEGRVLMKIWWIEACTDKEEVDAVRQYI